MSVKWPHQCWQCNIIKWSSAKDPRCPKCRSSMQIVTKSRCNSCGRELINQQEDDCGLCKVCQ